MIPAEADFIKGKGTADLHSCGFCALLEHSLLHRLRGLETQLPVPRARHVVGKEPVTGGPRGDPGGRPSPPQLV